MCFGTKTVIVQSCVPDVPLVVSEEIDYQELWKRITAMGWDMKTENVHFSMAGTDRVKVLTEKSFDAFMAKENTAEIPWSGYWNCNDAVERVRVHLREACPAAQFGIIWYIANPNHSIGIVALDTGIWLYETSTRTRYQKLEYQIWLMVL